MNQRSVRTDFRTEKIKSVAEITFHSDCNCKRFRFVFRLPKIILERNKKRNEPEIFLLILGPFYMNPEKPC